LSNLTFEELEALKAKLGTKVYNEAMFGTKTQTTISTSKKKLEKKFKRDNKNRPRELSSKTRVPRVREVVPVTRKKKRDPRFENLCGELNEEVIKLFNKSVIDAASPYYK
jgi:ribosomal RNA-processing protein 36